MIKHILVPLDGSSLAECVLPHATAIALANNAHITLLHVLERPLKPTSSLTIDPLEWQIKKREGAAYLDRISTLLTDSGVVIESTLGEGQPAEYIIDYALNNSIDLIALSSHGRSGLSGWNVSGVVQKIILRSRKSILLVRAYKISSAKLTGLRYRHLFVGLDCSARSEYILPIATTLAQFFNAQITIGTVVRKPELINRFPLSEEELETVAHISERNMQFVSHYFEQLTAQFAPQGIDLHTRLEVGDNVISALHDMVSESGADLVMLVAHGRSGDPRFAYGSVATSFIAYGTTALLILQDLASDEVKQTEAELAARETWGH
jgi:nucleotide-binding universal stress UspA family protein